MNKSITNLLTIIFLTNIFIMPVAAENNDKNKDQKKIHHHKSEAETELTFGIPVAKPKHKPHKVTLEDKCWDDDNCKFPTLFCLMFDPDNKKKKCKIPNS